MQRLDRRAIREIGIPALCLMENAGRAVAEETFRLVKSRKLKKNICIVCGAGNNGGDGFVAARHLLNFKLKVSIIVVGSRSRMSPESLVNCWAAQKLKIPFLKLDARGSTQLRRAGIIIDALFGTGLSRLPEGVYRQAIEAMNAAKVPILSIDVPSGLDATTGRAWGACVKPSVTVTLAYPKQGLFKADGRRCSGRVVVADIGIPYSLKIR